MLPLLAQGLVITPVPTGVVEVDRRPVYEVSGYVTLYVTVQEPFDLLTPLCAKLAQLDGLGQRPLVKADDYMSSLVRDNVNALEDV